MERIGNTLSQQRRLRPQPSTLNRQAFGMQQQRCHLIRPAITLRQLRQHDIAAAKPIRRAKVIDHLKTERQQSGDALYLPLLPGDFGQNRRQGGAAAGVRTGLLFGIL